MKLTNNFTYDEYIYITICKNNKTYIVIPDTLFSYLIST